MFLKLNHKKLDVYTASRNLVLECYKMCRLLPQHENFGMVSQIRRAAVSVHLNIAERASRKSESERKRFFEISRGSIIEIDAALDIANDLGYLKEINLETLEKAIIHCFKLVSGLIESKIHH